MVRRGPPGLGRSPIDQKSSEYKESWLASGEVLQVSGGPAIARRGTLDFVRFSGGQEKSSGYWGFRIRILY